MDYYSILNISNDATIDEIRNAYKRNKNLKTKKAYKTLKHNREEYDKLLLKYYREKSLNNNNSYKKESIFPKDRLNFSTLFGNIFNNELPNMMNQLNNKDGNFFSKEIISTTTLDKDGKYVTNRSIRTKDKKGTNENHERIQIDKDGNKIITNDGKNLFKSKNKFKIQKLLL